MAALLHPLCPGPGGVEQGLVRLSNDGLGGLFIFVPDTKTAVANHQLAQFARYPPSF